MADSTRPLLLTTVLTLLVMAVASAAIAQNRTALPGSPFTRLRTGDCWIAVTIPTVASGQPLPNLAQAILLRNENVTTAMPRLRRRNGRTELEFLVATPPLAGEQFQVQFTAGTQMYSLTDSVRVLWQDRKSCFGNDDRDLFDPTFFIGTSADAFAPNELEHYPADTDYRIKHAAIVQVEGQLRLGDHSGTWLDHVWLDASMKYAVRSIDLDCNGADKASPSCDPHRSGFAPVDNVGSAVTATVIRASKLDAVFAPRYEFPTRPDSLVPITVFVGARVGFGQAPGEVKVENMVSGGAGFLIPYGVAKNTSFSAMWGVDRGYATNPNGLRTRLDFRLEIGPKPGFKDQLPWLSSLARTPHALFEIISDRNSFGPGPDGTQTFFGLVIDAGALVR